MQFLRDVFHELCRTRLLYIIIMVLVAIGTDIVVRRLQTPSLPPPPLVAPKPAPAPVVVPPAPATIPSPVVVPIGPSAADKKARLVIVIDDMGLARAHTRAVIDLPAPLTLAFLPYADALATQTQAATARGHEVMLHMPMQPFGSDNPGPNAIRPDMAADEVAGTLRTALATLPGIKGINNHMGSAATADRATMDAVMQVLADQRLFFLDSVTTQQTQAQAAAQAHNVPYRARDLFLDHNPSQAAVSAALKQLEAVASRKGVAIAIGHPRPETIAALRDWLAQYDHKRFEIVPLSRLFMAVAPPPMPARTSAPANAD